MKGNCQPWVLNQIWSERIPQKCPPKVFLANAGEQHVEWPLPLCWAPLGGPACTDQLACCCPGATADLFLLYHSFFCKCNIIARMANKEFGKCIHHITLVSSFSETVGYEAKWSPLQHGKIPSPSSAPWPCQASSCGLGLMFPRSVPASPGFWVCGGLSKAQAPTAAALGMKGHWSML